MGTLSYSQLKSAEYCGEQLRLQKLNYPEPPAVYLIGGTAFHAATEDYDRAKYNGEAPTYEDIAGWWEHYWDAGLAEARQTEPDESKWRRGGRATKALPNKEDVGFWSDLGLKMVRSYAEYVDNEGWFLWELPDGEPAIEVAINVNIGDPMVRMFIDRVMVTPSGELVVRDLKTGRKPDDASQLGTYALGLERTFGVTASFGDYFMARDGKPTIPTSLAQYSLPAMSHRFNTLHRMRQSNLYLPKPGSHCHACGVRAACAFGPGGAGPDAASYANQYPEY